MERWKWTLMLAWTPTCLGGASVLSFVSCRCSRWWGDPVYFPTTAKMHLGWLCLHNPEAAPGSLMTTSFSRVGLQNSALGELKRDEATEAKFFFWKEFIRESVTCFFPLRSQILQLLGPAGWSGGFGDAMSGLKCPDMEGIQGPHPRGCFSPLNI